jgi:hypothetical protein
MSPVTGTIQPERENMWQPSVASARRAAERATRAAAVVSAWAERSGVARAEADEALRAGFQAREAANRAAVATSGDEVRNFARVAEAAARVALEADRRVSALISASLWAAEDARLAPSMQSAA